MRALILVALSLATVTAVACGGDDGDPATTTEDAGGSDATTNGDAGASDGATSDGQADKDVRGPNIGTWRVGTTPNMRTQDSTGIWGSGPNDIYLVGNSPPTLGPGGGVYHWDGGGAWHDISNNSGFHFHDVSGVAPNDVWAVGYQGGGALMQGTDGGAWSSRGPGPAFGNFFTQIWGAGPSDYWAITGNLPTQLVHLEGASWVTVDTGANGAFFVTGIAGHVFALSYLRPDGGAVDYVVAHRAGTSWSVLSLGAGAAAPFALWAAGPNELFVVGDEGSIQHYDGNAWTKQSSGTTRRLTAIWGTGPDDVFAGGNGALLHYDGTAWTPESFPDGGAFGFTDIWGSGRSDVWAVGTNGVVFHRTP
ncbi:MAG: Glucosyltransferase-I precursor [Myxococcaceae bacterium]|nr:Glucosyltransferase-I precursor [Myxococcaceae bacterium]